MSKIPDFIKDATKHSFFLIVWDLSFDNTKEKSEKREPSRASGAPARKNIALE